MRKIVGLEITMKASDEGKQAGFYLDRDTFVTLDRMGDGVTEMVAFIVELCTERNKIFVLEEPETNLHPQGLKALMAMIRAASEHNQFFIATHSSIVVRELEGVFRSGDAPDQVSSVEEVERSPQAHIELMQELGYAFGDFQLHDAWLFLEEASAEAIIREVLVPMFVPELVGKLRTYSAGGIGNVEPGVLDFQRLMVFVHLQPAYVDRFWVRVDGDESGRNVVRSLREKFRTVSEDAIGAFERPRFEDYYPKLFEQKASDVAKIADKKSRQKAKAMLLQSVLDWTKSNGNDAREEWEKCAQEQIQLLQLIAKSIVGA
jgi:AAA domain, putative AbiEii toxin, Type IV TA system